MDEWNNFKPEPSHGELHVKHLRWQLSENGAWGSWGSYGACSKTCGTGKKTRTRTCNNPAPIGNGAACPGSSSEDADCNTQPCPSKKEVLFCLICCALSALTKTNRILMRYISISIAICMSTLLYVYKIYIWISYECRPLYHKMRIIFSQHFKLVYLLW